MEKSRDTRDYSKPRIAPVCQNNAEFLEDAFVTLYRAIAKVEKSVLLNVSSISSQTPRRDGGIDFYDEVRNFERGLIKQALRSTGGHQSRAAALLGLTPSTLNSKMKAHNIKAMSPYIADSQDLLR
jgi:transcriptional regulator with GAF, ATPase, and Fis domain